MLNVGRMNLQADQMTFSVGDDVAIAAFDLLRGIKAAWPAVFFRSVPPSE